MRHRIFGRQLNRTHNQRQALFRSMLRSLFTHGFIKTTDAKAKAILSSAEKITSKSIKGDLSSIRSINKIFDDRNFTKAVSEKVQTTFPDRKSNFLKIEKVGFRQGDNALIVKLSFVEKLIVPEIKEIKEVKKVKVVKKKETTK
jgi:large subunit ribosomal protein L17